jgi:hypothetical protein
MRTSKQFGMLVALTGVAVLAVAVDFNLLLNAPLPADMGAAVVQLGNAQIPVPTATLLQYLFLAIGLGLVTLGFVIGLRRRPRSPPRRASRGRA